MTYHPSINCYVTSVTNRMLHQLKTSIKWDLFHIIVANVNLATYKLL